MEVFRKVLHGPQRFQTGAVYRRSDEIVIDGVKVHQGAVRVGLPSAGHQHEAEWAIHEAFSGWEVRKCKTREPIVPTVSHRFASGRIGLCREGFRVLADE